MGGFCDLNWSVNPHWKPNFKPRKHPIWNGVQPFSVDDEWYYHMRFVEDRTGFTPILTDVPPMETLKRPDGMRSGNPAVRKAVANGESQHVAWAYESDQKVVADLVSLADIIMTAGRTIIIGRSCSMRFFGPPVWKFQKTE